MRSGFEARAHLALSLSAWTADRLAASGARGVVAAADRLSATSDPSRRSPVSRRGRPGRDVTSSTRLRKPLDAPRHRPDRGHDRSGEILPPRPAAGGPATNPGQDSIWPAIHPAILQLIREHAHTIVFTTSRRLAERLAQRLNDLAGEELVRAHPRQHRPRAAGRDRGELKAGRVPQSSRRAASNWASTWARRPRHPGREPDVVLPAASSVSVGRSSGRGAVQGRDLPENRGDLLEPRSSPRACTTVRSATLSALATARRPRPAARCDDRYGPLDGSRAPRRGHPGDAVRDAQS